MHILYITALKVPHKTCKKKGLPAQTILICAIVGGLTASLLSTVPLVDAAPVYDYDNGSWTDLYSDNTGTSARSQANVDTSDGKLKLTNSGGGFIAPFYTTGYVRTTSIGAEAGVKIARWGTVTLTRELPPDTSITVQVLDEGNQIYPNSLLAGNETGFTDSVIDISDLALERTAVPGSAKVPRIRLLITLATINTDVTPEVDSVVVSWTTEQGDLSETTLADTA